MTIRDALAGATVALALTLGAVPSALACKCMMPSAEMAKEQATAVFEGHVRAIDVEPAKSEAGIETNLVTLAIVRTWKGLENEETVKVRTSASTASCGIAFEKGVSYLVYAGEGPHGLEVGSCGGTRPLADAGDHLAVLGAGITPVKVESTPAASGEAEKGKDDANKPPAAKGGGCASTSAKGHASASLLMMLPGLGLVMARRRKR